jgi:hydrogenase/urease accessory protein HupE
MERRVQAPCSVTHVRFTMKTFFRSCLFLSLLAAQLLAHDPGLSNVELRMAGGQLIAFLAYARPEIETLVPIDANRDGTVTTEEFEAARPKLEELARQALEIKSNGVALEPLAVKASLGAVNDVEFYLTYFGDVKLPLAARSLLLPKLARGHKQMISLRDDQGEAVGEQILDEQHDTFDTGAPVQTSSFWEFFKLGVEHIFTGYDHLLFLFALLLVGGTFTEAAKIITSFTVAHSLTLAVATLGWVSMRSTIVEPLIAASILYVGLENLWHKNLNWRWLLTFAFGLIHGFGFASILRERGVGANGSGVAMPLFSFNLGVEAGQLALAILILPVLWKLHQWPNFKRYVVPTLSVIVALAGLYWLLERTVWQ